MTKQMLIDAAHPEETRVVVVNKGRVEDFDFETSAREQLRGNIYLAKVTRVEPSLQAAFVEYGGNRHGFLAFGEIHPDYYQIPAEDRAALIAEEEAAAARHAEDDDDLGDDDGDLGRQRRAAQRKYKIQEVIRRRQVLLVQVVKEERGNKGAALTTYLSLAGRYCVLMPNTPRGGGISRKITALGDRKRLKKVVSELELPKGMGLIIRTAGAKRTKTEIKRDYEYLMRLWDDIRERTLKSMAPAAIHSEDNLVKRAIRDHYDKDIDAVLVQGEHAYREVKDFAKMLMPSHARKVQPYKGTTPLFARLGVEQQLASMHDHTVRLKSGGYIVINQTEALVAIDVNSGKATKERSIESTALKTNLEAAEEAALQMRLRDLAGLVVIDFIDMEESRNDRAVEKKLKDALRNDRARVQMGKISMFGLMEISRQRRRTGVMEGTSHICEVCDGTGRVRSSDSTALQALRDIETATGGRRNAEVALHADTETALYLLNEKRAFLVEVEETRGLIIRVIADSGRRRGSYAFEIVEPGEAFAEPDLPVIEPVIDDEIDEELDEDDIAIEDTDGDGDGDAVTAREGTDDSSEEGGRRRRRRRRGRRGDGDAGRVSEARTDGDEAADASTETDAGDDEGGEGDDGEAPARDGETAESLAETNRRRRRRGRRGGRRRRREDGTEGFGGESDGQGHEAGDDSDSDEAGDGDASVDAAPAAKLPAAEPEPDAVVETDGNVAPVEAADPAAKPKRVRKPRMTKAAAAAAAAEAAASEASGSEESTEAAVEAVPVSDTGPADAQPVAAAAPAARSAPADDAAVTPTSPEPPAQPRRTGWWARNAAKLFNS
jgi:ribonuclease E